MYARARIGIALSLLAFTALSACTSANKSSPPYSHAVSTPAAAAATGCYVSVVAIDESERTAALVLMPHQRYVLRWQSVSVVEPLPDDWRLTGASSLHDIAQTIRNRCSSTVIIDHREPGQSFISDGIRFRWLSQPEYDWLAAQVRGKS